MTTDVHRCDCEMSEWHLADISNITFEYGFCRLAGDDRRLAFIVKFKGASSDSAGLNDQLFVEAAISAGILGFDAQRLILDMRGILDLDEDLLEAAVHTCRSPLTRKKLPLALILPPCRFEPVETLTGAYQKDSDPSSIVENLDEACRYLQACSEKGSDTASLSLRLRSFSCETAKLRRQVVESEGSSPGKRQLKPTESDVDANGK